jgi:hypothetical protein
MEGLMNLEWMVPYLLVAIFVFLIPKIPGILGRRKSSASHGPTFVPHYISVAAALIMLAILLSIIVKAVIALMS